MTDPATSHAADRSIRIFISSTFRDMHAERELLVKRVFPELRRLCSERFVTFTEVDLRWGITEEQAAEGKVLPICLEEIERSRPWFIGLLGERYGWIAEDAPPDVIKREPWLREHVGQRTSVTELEILHGVLRNPDMLGQAYFYFRDPDYLNRLPSGTVRTDFDAESDEAQARLAQLKSRIRAAHDAGACQLQDRYRDPEALAEAVRSDLTELIDRLYPKEAVPDPLDQEAQGHAAHARSKRFAYVERPAHTAALDAAVAGVGLPLVVTGDSGGGKTALLAAWAARWADRSPGDVVFQHYFGATPQSASVSGFLHRLLGELKRRYDIVEEIPAQLDRLREALPLWLAHTAGRGRLVLVLDGLNQIEGDEPDRRLAFVPHHFPPNVRVVASALPGPALDTLRERGWAEHALPLPDADERDRMIGTFLETYRKSLRPDLRRKLVAAPGASNPLFLRTVLEELRQFGSFTELPARVGHYLEADTPEELFRRVLRRWQADFDAGRDLVRDAVTALWAARQGLAEAEWLELLGSAGQPLARRAWHPLFVAMEPHLAQRAGLHAFGHDFLRRAVEREFLPDTESQRAAHRSLADYFERQLEMTPRGASEWPWQLTEAGAWERLRAALATRSLFLALYTQQTRLELTGYWLRLTEARPELSMGATYPTAYEIWMREEPDPREASFAANQLASFLTDNGAYAQAEPLRRRALEGYERVLGVAHPNTLTSVNNLADVLTRQGDYAQAEPLYRRAVEEYERLLGVAHPYTLTSVIGLAAVLVRQGHYAQAEPLYRRGLEGYERVLGAAHPSTLATVYLLADVLVRQGDHAQAEPLYRRAVEEYERVLGAAHPDTLTGVIGLAAVLVRQGHYARAETLYRRGLEGYERVLGAAHPSTLATGNLLADVLVRQGDYAQAEPLYRRAVEEYECVLGAAHPDTLTSVIGLAAVLVHQSDYAQAEALFRRGVEGYERVLGAAHPSTLAAVILLAVVLVYQGDHAQAEQLLRRGLEGSQRVLGTAHPETLTSVHYLAVVLVHQGDYPQAEPLLRRALEGRERVLGAVHPDTLASVAYLGHVLMHKGDHAQAEQVFRRALEGSQRVLGAAHPETLKSVNLLALVLTRQGGYMQAEPLFRRALEGSKRVLGAEHPDTLSYVHNLAFLLTRQGDYAHAEALFRSALEGLSRILGPDHPHTVTCRDNLETLLEEQPGQTAGQLEATGRYEQALQHREAAVQAEVERVGPNHPDVALALNLLAILLRKLGRAAEAEHHLRRAITIERQALPPDSPKHAHRLNSLCTVLVMQGKHAEARSLLAEAWALKTGRHDITSARILFVRLAIALLETEAVSTCLGQLKTLLASEALEAAGNVTTTWDVDAFLGSLRPRLAPSDADLLEALAAALNDRATVPDLDRYPAWQGQPRLPLDAAWPDPPRAAP